MTRGYGHFLGFVGDWVRFSRRSDVAYRTLGVSESADDAEIEQAYLRQMAPYQPERLVGLAESIRRRAQKKAVEIDTAYARIRALRRRPVSGARSVESSQSAVARSDDRATSGALVGVTLVLIAVVTLAWLGPMRALWDPTPIPAPQASAGSAPTPSVPVSDVPAPPAAVVAPGPSPASPVPVAEAPIEHMVVLMPKDPPPGQAVSPAPQAPPALRGEAALVEALRAGQLRPASGGDISRWALRWSEVNRRGLPSGFEEHRRGMTAYVIQKDFTIPEGLNGAHAVIFLLDTRVPYPRGDPGHSVVLDLSTGACMGVTCGMLLD